MVVNFRGTQKGWVYQVQERGLKGWHKQVGF